MSRRPNPAESRTEANRATLKSLVKLESNKSCADCKRNKHPRWASWNLGIFVCIRCSGIHRGMGTHISRVKSVDLDSWTDEQMQSMLQWGNGRANKYWEAKLAPGHVPSEAKIENFIRTKYESKRWVMDGPMPDPATLDTGGDDDVPLNLVQEKAKLERSSSIKAAAAAQSSKAPPRQAQNIDLFGDDPTSTPPRPNTTEPPVRAVPPKAEAAPPKQTKPADSLLGLDFFGGGPSDPPARPASTSGATGSSNVPSRPDLKQSILSLYAAAPKPAAVPQPQQSPPAAFGMQASPAHSPPPQQAGFGGLNDAFSSLNFSSPTAQQPAKPSPFAGLMSSVKSPTTTTHTTTSPGFGGGGSFFDMGSKPAITPSAAPKPQQAQQRTVSSSSGFGDFLSSTSSNTAAPAARTTNVSNDLFDLSAPAPQPVAAPIQPAVPASSSINSAFNLSAPKPAPAQPAQQPHPGSFSNLNSTMSGDNPWGSSDDWSSAAPAKSPAATKTDFGWSANNAAAAKPAAQPQVAAEEDFGGWSTAAPAAPIAPPPSNTSTQPPKPAGGFGGGGDDLFGNVWG